MQAIDLDPSDATLFSNRSFCLLRQGDGETALQDALECRELRPDWPKACYRHGAALLSLEVGYTLLTGCRLFLLAHSQGFVHQEYGSACQALLDGLKLDPENAEMERALRYPCYTFCIVACTFWHISAFVIYWKHVISAACLWLLYGG